MFATTLNKDTVAYIMFVYAPPTSEMTLNHNRLNAQLNVSNDIDLQYKRTMYSDIAPSVTCNDHELLFGHYAPNALHM